MELIAEIIFFFVQLLLEVIGEALLELGLSGFKDVFDRRNWNPYLAAIGYLVLGAVLGGVSLCLWPQRVFQSGTIPGLSIVLSPLAGGAAMHAWGRFRRSRGHDPTNLATFLGGAAFALGCAVVRFQWAR
jgi:hypothetical protein